MGSHVRGHLVRSDQRELELLGAAADGGQHLLRISRGQDEHDVGRRFLQGLEQRIRGRRGQHVHLVEQVHLATPGADQGCLLGHVADVVDRVVGRCVKLDEVQRGASGNGGAAVTSAARFAVVAERLAVERFGQDACGGGLAGAAGAAQQVRVTDAVLADGIAQGPDQVRLSDYLCKPLRSEPPVERLVRHLAAILKGAAEFWRPSPRRRLPAALFAALTGR